jgi:hypothetical protein
MRVRWASPVACMGEMRNYVKFMSENLTGTDHLGVLGVDEVTIKTVLVLVVHVGEVKCL